MSNLKYKLKKSFKTLLDEPLSNSRLTKELYIELHTKGPFIAHFNRDRFHRARFWTLADFDKTLQLQFNWKLGE